MALGRMYFVGKGVVKDFEEAAKWYRKTSKLESQKDETESSDVSWLRKAAGQGHARAQNHLADFMNGVKGFHTANTKALNGIGVLLKKEMTRLSTTWQECWNNPKRLWVGFTNRLIKETRWHRQSWDTVTKTWMKSHPSNGSGWPVSGVIVMHNTNWG